MSKYDWAPMPPKKDPYTWTMNCPKCGLNRQSRVHKRQCQKKKPANASVSNASGATIA